MNEALAPASNPLSRNTFEALIRSMACSCSEMLKWALSS